MNESNNINMNNMNNLNMNVNNMNVDANNLNNNMPSAGINNNNNNVQYDMNNNMPSAGINNNNNNVQYDMNNNMTNNQMNFSNNNMNNNINNGNNYPMNNYQNGVPNGNAMQDNYQNNMMNNNMALPMNGMVPNPPVEDPMDAEVKRILEISEISERCERIKSILYRELSTFEENELPDSFSVLKFIMKFTKLQDELFATENNLNIMKIPTKFLNIYYPEYYEKIIISIIKMGMEFLKSRNLDLDGLYRQRSEFIKMIVNIQEHLKSQKYLVIPNIIMALNISEEEKVEVENLVKALNGIKKYKFKKYEYYYNYYNIHIFINNI